MPQLNPCQNWSICSHPHSHKVNLQSSSFKKSSRLDGSVGFGTESEITSVKKTKKKPQNKEAKTEFQDAALIVLNFWQKQFEKFHVNSVAQVAW